MRTVTFLLIDQMLATGTVLPLEMLRGAESRARVEGEGPAMRLVTTSQDGKPVTTSSGFSFTPDAPLANTPDSDLIYIPALWRNPRPALKRSGPLLKWLRDQAEAGAAISAVGTGVCFLAEAGLLDGKPATTHWHYFERFATDYPQIKLKRQYFITRADKLFCAASVNALADVTVYLIRQLYGPAVASHVERNFSHEIRRPFEEIAYSEGAVQLHPDEDIIQAQTWLKEHCSEDIRLSTVAKRFEMSVRSFNRRFKLATGQTPLQYLQNVRVDMARELLQSTNLSVNEIAEKVGYQDMGHFTALFKKFLSTTPSEYRTTVRAKLFRVDT
ncbi:GlxA family transcriptional regulator [Microbulbifer thermotolerans]|uniref:AraC family transcriptional regulator n=1 Tax=Microbulbifer thermotolerans TaxID=252514 RepID=A0A143HMI7_MICTH|nr:helix-turn-helix domain-containing protein [Microbulbifer thermotolerans]AMX02741.1 AraC family transcriptional regulator [Microbulbifer thermotolerans]MCX2779596.1 helix-turn-helix domain-containing protein [Microbulbifer thermotolerans]MCX2782562.1 helix-turn-helix domain-containing protein [Microbulbifer thermotolerans]MCX2794574.1 helix-turn-helix domain-containing protein [Microbulbifer thermotolerans]MCX2801402.1 helix-turn-helix domain-containing protein [Microbulbifer thermotolerans